MGERFFGYPLFADDEVAVAAIAGVLCMFNTGEPRQWALENLYFQRHDTHGREAGILDGPPRDPHGKVRYLRFSYDPPTSRDLLLYARARDRRIGCDRKEEIAETVDAAFSMRRPAFDFRELDCVKRGERTAVALAREFWHGGAGDKWKWHEWRERERRKFRVLAELPAPGVKS